MKPTRKLQKHRPPSYSRDGTEVLAYEHESFTDGLSALVDSLLSGGIVFTDTLRASIVSAHATLRSPVKITGDSSGAGFSLSGAVPLEVGVRVNLPPPPQHTIPAPDSRTPGGIGTYSARQDGTRG